MDAGGVRLPLIHQELDDNDDGNDDDLFGSCSGDHSPLPPPLGARMSL